MGYPISKCTVVTRHGYAGMVQGRLAHNARHDPAGGAKKGPYRPGRQQWVLRNTRTGQYLQLDDRDVFIWNQVDGDNTVRDILFAYAERYGELALPRIERTLHTFAAVGLVAGCAASAEREAADAAPDRPGHRHGLLRLELSIRALDRSWGRLYRGSVGGSSPGPACCCCGR